MPKIPKGTETDNRAIWRREVGAPMMPPVHSAPICLHGRDSRDMRLTVAGVAIEGVTEFSCEMNPQGPSRLTLTVTRPWFGPPRG